MTISTRQMWVVGFWLLGGRDITNVLQENTIDHVCVVIKPQREVMLGGGTLSEHYA